VKPKRVQKQIGHIAQPGHARFSTNNRESSPPPPNMASRKAQSAFPSAAQVNWRDRATVWQPSTCGI
jgi:hypothetical protein